MTTIGVFWPCSPTCGHERVEVCAAFSIRNRRPVRANSVGPMTSFHGWIRARIENYP